MRTLIIAMLMTGALGLGCDDGANSTFRPQIPTDNTVDLPPAFQQNAVGTAAAGRLSSGEYHMVFSLGGAVPPLRSDEFVVNNAGEEN